MKTENDIWNLLAHAIATRHQVVATYNGRPRAFCPHALGMKRGKRHALVYQIGGYSSGRPTTGWRCLDVDAISDAELRPGPWRSDANAFNPQSCMDEVLVVVQPFPPAVQPVESTASTA
jgi:hypothetical protein